MALKPDRFEDATDISYFMNVTGERGIIVVHNGTGSGAAMDQAEATVVIPTGTVSGTKPAGLLLNDVVNIDLTRQHLNAHQDETQVGGKVTILRRGFVNTNMVSGTPAAGDKVYYNVNGTLTAVAVANSTQVGQFLSAKDADGYAKVEINIT